MRLLLFLFLLLFLGCDPCGKLDCATGDRNVQFRIIDKQSGSDLLFGPSRIYHPDSIQFYSIKDLDTTFYEPRKDRIIRSQANDSLVYVIFFRPSSTVYMRLKSGDVDTLKLGLKSYDTRCCGRLTDITSLRLNDSLHTRNSDWVYTFLK